MMRILYEVCTIGGIIGLGYLFNRFKMTKDMKSGMMSSSYLIALLFFVFFDGDQKALMDLLMVFKPIVYSSLMVKFIETIIKPEIRMESVLTQRERTVVDLIIKGMTNKEIAEVLIISEMTVKKHV